MPLKRLSSSKERTAGHSGRRYAGLDEERTAGGSGSRGAEEL
jgi:hypothetical protein